MSELDERTLTPMAVAAPRYQGDPSRYAPDMRTVYGAPIGRSLPGTATSTPLHSGALQLFLPHGQDLGTCEHIICELCDHAQVHPAIMHWGDEQATVGRGYWVRAELPHLMELNKTMQKQQVVGMAPVLMVPPPDTYTNQAHGRVIIPFMDGRMGVPAVSGEDMAWLYRILSDGRRMVLEHVDFNGIHLGCSDTDESIEWSLNRVRAKFDTTVLHNLGMSAFQSKSVNIEKYPVVIL